MHFCLDERQIREIADWSAEQDNMYKKSNLIKDNCEYYCGAIGGELTYLFTPTSIGMAIKVHHSGTNQNLDVSHYEDW